MARTLLPYFPSILWVLITSAFIQCGFRIFRSLLVQEIQALICAAAACGLALAGFVFKLTFTRKDAPELLLGNLGSGISWMLLELSGSFGTSHFAVQAQAVVVKAENIVETLLGWPLRPFRESHLVLQAQTVFLGIGIVAGMSILSGVRGRNRKGHRPGWFHFVAWHPSSCLSFSVTLYSHLQNG